MATDAEILNGYLKATEGKDKSIEDACNALDWSLSRYIDALGALFGSYKADR